MRRVIYGIRNKLDGKWYVGCTLNLKRRWNQHLHVGKSLYEAVCKDGVQNFKLHTLAYANNKTDAETLEAAWIKKKNSLYPNGYNLTSSGGAKDPCAETRRKISAATKGYPGSMKGKHHSIETRRKIGAASKGRSSPTKGIPLSSETRQKISNALRGRSLSDEHRKKIGIKSKGRVVSAETRQKISDANRGKRLSAETRQKMSESHKGRHI